MPKVVDVDPARRAERERQLAARIAEKELEKLEKEKDGKKEPAFDAQAEFAKLTSTRSGGVYMPPARLRAMQEAASKDKASAEYQRISWDARLQSVLDSLDPGTFTPASATAVLHNVADTDVLPVTAGPDGQTSPLQVLHTPGHTPDSLCLYYSPDRALFTADTVLGHGTAVFEDLGPYMASLRKMIAFARGPDGTQTYNTVYPGHGPVATEGLSKITTYLHHREEREAQIVKVLQLARAESEGGWTTEAIVGNIYAKYPRELWAPAAHSVELHLKKLEGDGRVEKVDGAWVLLGH